MQKIYSSLNENFVREIEEEVKPAFNSWAGDDWDRVKALLDDIKLFIKVNKLQLNLKSFLISNDKEIKYKKLYEVYKPKWDDVSEQYDRQLIKYMYRLYHFVDEYGLKKLLTIEYFSEWLSTTKGDFDYYDCRS